MTIQNYKSAGVLILGLFVLWAGPLGAAGLVGIDFAGDVISLNTSTGVGTLIGASGVPGPSSLVSSGAGVFYTCLLYTSPSPRDGLLSRMPSSA